MSVFDTIQQVVPRRLLTSQPKWGTLSKAAARPSVCTTPLAHKTVRFKAVVTIQYKLIGNHMLEVEPSCLARVIVVVIEGQRVVCVHTEASYYSCNRNSYVSDCNIVDLWFRFMSCIDTLKVVELLYLEAFRGRNSGMT